MQREKINPQIEKIREICSRFEEIAEYQICYESKKMIWISKLDLDWLADEEQIQYAQTLRRIMRFNIDFEGGYYYLSK